VAAFQEVDTDREHANTLISRASSLPRVQFERPLSCPACDAVPGDLSAWQVQRIVEFIDKRLDQPLLLEDLSKTIGLSAGDFGRAFRRSFGISPHAYVVRRRVERACHLILTSGLSLSEVCGSQELLSYVSKLIEALRSRYQSEPQQTRAPTATVTSPISEPLSTREGNILKLIAEGLSNKEIARNLAIAPETVKSHVKHIFIKLNVEKRAQAVSRAQILGLLTESGFLKGRDAQITSETFARAPKFIFMTLGNSRVPIPQDCAARPPDRGYRLQK
jgi:DNA-binding NarL/FixJ family response regulator